MCETLFDDGHFINEVAGTGKFFYHKQDIPCIYANGSLGGVLKHDIATHGFPIAIESKTYEMPIAFDF